MDDLTVSQLIQRRRETAGMSVREVSRLSTVSEGRIRQIEKGYAVASAGMHVPVRPSARTLRLLAGVLDLDADLLIRLATAEDGVIAEPDARAKAHQAFAALISADPTLDTLSKSHIINQHELLQGRSVPEMTVEELNALGKQKLADAKAVKAKRKRQTPGASSTG